MQRLEEAGALERAIGTWFGCGLLPVVPATWASASAAILGLFVHEWLGWSGWQFVVLALVVSVPAVWAASRIETSRGTADPDMVVVDEVVGQWLALAGASTINWFTVLVAFFVFRILDIWKPPPVRQLERLPSGIGIVADDLMAGLYGAIFMFVLFR